MFAFNNSTPATWSDPLPDSVDVVVIGAGVIGVCSAWFLCQRGLSVLVCDKGVVAGEQSSRNWGWVRSTGRDPDEVPVSMLATNLWEQFQQELGDGIGFRRESIMAVTDSQQELAELESWLEIAQQFGLDTRAIGPEEARRLSGASDNRWLGGIATASDGRAEPFTAVPTLAAALREKGGLVRERCAVRCVETEAGRISAVVTEHGTVKTSSVICAAGGWSSLFLSNLGIDFPQLVLRGTVARTKVTDDFFGGAAGLGDVFVRRRNDGGYTVATGFAEHFIGANSFRFLFKFIPTMGSASDMAVRLQRDPTQQGIFKKRWGPADVSPFEHCRVNDPAPSPRALRKMRAKLKQQVPQLADVEFEESWAGMIDATPDVVPVMDGIPDCPGLFLATGFSGHGFGIGPGAGKVMADLVTGDDTGFDLSRFRFSRFSDGSKIRPGPAI
jgi:glycine/D-amino acid oxidase-like deaminating enzyme